MLADHVYDELMGAFVEGRLEADAPLNIDGMSREMQISPTPIREALARLESTGLVVRTALKGYRVAPIFSAEEISELMQARRVLEPENAYLSCMSADDETLDDLRHSIEELERSLTIGSAEAIKPYWEADERFHRTIAESAGNRFLLASYRALGGHVQRFRLFGGLGVSDAEPAIAEHHRILEAFTAHDPDAARARMAEHIDLVRDRALNDQARYAH